MIPVYLLRVEGAVGVGEVGVVCLPIEERLRGLGFGRIEGDVINMYNISRE